MPAIASAIISNMSGSGLEPIQKMARMDMIMQGLIEPETDEEKQQLQQAQAKAEQEAQQPNLEESLAKQAESEAEERSSKVADNLASAEKKAAETETILRELPATNAKTAADIRKIDADIQQSLFENVSGLPLQ